jgi:hypothetical protein
MIMKPPKKIAGQDQPDTNSSSQADRFAAWQNDAGGNGPGRGGIHGDHRTLIQRSQDICWTSAQNAPTLPWGICQLSEGVRVTTQSPTAIRHPKTPQYHRIQRFRNRSFFFIAVIEVT